MQLPSFYKARTEQYATSITNAIIKRINPIIRVIPDAST
jgi:hypothetical protein